MVTTERSLDRPAGGYGFSVIVALLVASIVARPALASFFDDGRLRTWSTVFVAICLQALPFLCLGVVLSGVIAACISETMLKRVIPQKPALAVPFAKVEAGGRAVGDGRGCRVGQKLPLA